MARRTNAQQTGRKIAERSRGGKQKSPKTRKTPRSATPRPKRVASSGADGAEDTRTIRESSVERTGQSGSRDETLAAPPGSRPSVPNTATPPQPGRSWTPRGVHLSLGPLTIEAEQAEIEKGALKATLSVRRGDKLLYRDRVNFDWSGGRDKFLRKAARALAAAGLTTHLDEALLADLRSSLRTRAEERPTDPAAGGSDATPPAATRPSIDPI